MKNPETGFVENTVAGVFMSCLTSAVCTCTTTSLHAQPEPCQAVYEDLAAVSERDKPWDGHRTAAVSVQAMYADGGEEFERFADRMNECSWWLRFTAPVDPSTGEIGHQKLDNARFCRVRHCPVCQWRKSLMWKARFSKALPELESQHPTARWLFLTLTVRNCEVSDLRETLAAMNQAWRRFMLREEVAGVVQGYLRTTEVTRGADGSAHPHFHVLLMVRPSYFGKGYIKAEKWAELWKSCARLDYTPVVNVQAVKNKKTGATSGTAGLRDAVAETLKYAVKPADMVVEPEWFYELHRQTKGLRFLADGGTLKNLLREPEKESDLLVKDDEPEADTGLEVVRTFNYNAPKKRYQRRLRAG
ncbi:protein rep [Burkholderia vietnamiensis]|uniref:protein rep n=1 Tax=Burkholderia vietnamiensis TaxID=60552 RepID=UPI001CF4D62B|nr:protein rep [Burkholderia vietnamiensis]MCA8292086.1 protein rep [Burkholderia vietnamiensis]